MLILVIIFYFMDVRRCGKDFVTQNCNLFERIGRWFVIFGWLEMILISYLLFTIAQNIN